MAPKLRVLLVGDGWDDLDTLAAELQRLGRDADLAVVAAEGCAAAVAASDWDVVAARATAGDGETALRRAVGDRPLVLVPGGTAAAAAVAVAAVVGSAADARRALAATPTDQSVERLRQAVLSMSTDEDWAQVVEVFAREAHALMEFEACSINLIDWDRNQVRSYGYDSRRGFHCNLNPRIHESLRLAIERDQPVLRRSRRDPLWGEELGRHLQSVVDVPFGEGTVALNSAREDAFGPVEVAILERFAGVLANAHRRLDDLTALAARTAELEVENRERRQAEERQAALLRHTRAVLAAADELIAAPDVDTLCRRAVELARERLGLDRCALFLIGPEPEVLLGTFGTDPEGCTTVESGYRMPVWPEGRELFTSRPAGGPRWQMRRQTELLYRGQVVGRGDHAITLVQSGERALGVLFNDNLRTGEPLDESRQEAVALYGSLLGNILERRRAQDGLDRERAQLAAIMRATDVQLVYLDPQFNFVAVNEAYAASCRRPPEDLLGRNHFDLYPHAENEAIFRQVRDTGQAVFFKDKPFEFPDQPERGVTYWDWSLVPVLGTAGCATGLVFSLRETTRHKLAEIALRESEERLRRLYNQTPALLHSIDAAGRFISVTDDWLAAMGYTREDVVGKLAIEFMTPESREQAVSRFLPEFRRTGFWKDLPLDFLRRDGQVMHTLLSATAERGPAGEVLRSMSVLTDITARRAAEEALRASEQRWQFALEGAEDGVWDWDLLTGAVYFSDRYKSMLGYGSDDLDGRVEAWSELLHPDDQAAAYAALERHLSGQAPVYVAETRLRCQDGSYRWILDRGKVVERTAAGQPSRMIGTHTDITARKESEEALRQSEERLRLTLEAADVVAWEIDADTLAHRETGPVERLFGHPAGLQHTALEDLRESIHPDDRARLVDHLEAALRGGGPYRAEYRVPQSDGSDRWVEAVGKLVSDAAGHPSRLLGIARDITARKQAEAERESLQAQLVQAQKMEAVGQLAGGIAHDFNNMLLVILGHVDLMLSDLPPDHELREDLLEVRHAAQHSADLTRQLLAFARRQTAAPQVLDLNDTVTGLLNMLRRLIGEHLELAWLPGAGLWPVRIDPAQVDQILANLLVNARDAMGERGRVSIQTANTEVDAALCAAVPDLVPGRYVRLRVTDTGTGMDQETLQHLFEPFFTTKEVGRGTGLGLATVYGIVRQNNGAVQAASELGRGSSFTVYLPAVPGVTAASTGRSAETDLARGRGETVLLVEDEPAVLNLGRQMLASLGYQVVAAASAAEALEVAAPGGPAIDLLLVDVVMPDLNGRELAERLVKLRPGLPCLFVSGYSADVLSRQGWLEPGVELLQKPFVVQDLAARVRAALDASPA